MRIAFQVEGPTDLMVLPILTRRLLGEAVEPVYRFKRPGGVDAVRSTLADVAREFWNSDAAGIVVAIDNDDRRPLHDWGHAGREAEYAREGCNYCGLLRLLPALPERRPPFRYAVGVAVQALESWLLFGAHWARRHAEPEPEECGKDGLKIRLYGTPHPNRRRREAICLPVAEHVDLDKLAAAAPSFAFFAAAIRAFKAPERASPV